MARLSLFLPPPAGDYSGAAGVLFGLDCLVVLVDAGCCTRNYTEYDEPRWARRRKTAFSAQLRTLEAVLGDEERIVEQTAEGVHELGVSCAALLGTPVPAVTGMNLPGIACDVEAQAGVPALGIETCGFETYERGASRAFKALVNRFAHASEAAMSRDEAAPLRVNVLGHTAQDFMGEADMQACLGWLQEAGLEIAFSSAGSYTLDDVAAAGQADASVVVAWSGLAAARELQQRCGVPYVVGKPWCAEDARMLAKLVRKAAGGETQSGPLCMWNEEREATISVAELADSLEAAATGEGAIGTPKTTPDVTTGAAEAVGSTTASMSKPACTAPADEDIHETADPTLAPATLSPILLIGEQVAMCSLRMHVRAALAQASLSAPVVVATRFSADSALAEPGDLSEIGERELIAWAHKNPGFTWVGDPLFERIPAFAGHGAAILPHEATSSTLYTDLAKELAGGTALEHAQRGIMERCHQKTQAE